MDKLAALDWRLLQALLAVADTGSLSGAAERLGSSQPTLGRQVAELERLLGFPVFARHARGYAPTEAGRALLPAARAMGDAAAQLALAAEGRSQHLAGTVRITASVMVATYWLPGIVGDLRRAEPEIRIEIVPTDRSENLLYREADIALRMYRPEQLDVVTRHLGDVSLGLFAHRDYLARRGRPETVAELAGHDLIGLDREQDIIRGFRAIGHQMTRDDFALRCDDHSVIWQMIRAGAGIGFTQLPLARRMPESGCCRGWSCRCCRSG